MARLMKLSPSELKTLLCKYFKKVVDLRESGRKMEAQIADLDVCINNYMLLSYYIKIERMLRQLSLIHI